MSEDCYKVLPFSDLKYYLDQENRSLSSDNLQLKTNLAHIYYLNSGKVIMLASPRSNDSKGILFDSKSCYLDFLNKDHFPIQNESPSILEEFQDDVANINIKIDSIINHLFKLPEISSGIGSQHNNSLVSLLITLKPKFKRLSRKDSFYAALVLGEYIRRDKSGEWVLLKRYGTFNPYFIPAICCPDGSVVLFWDYLRSYFEQPGSPEIFLQLPWILNPKTKLDGRFISNSYAGYKVLKVNR